MANYSKYFPIIDYYERVVVPLNKKRYYVKSGKMMVCPCHDDHDPSLGLIKSKNGEEAVHCFGCNFWGNVVDLHKRVNKRHNKRYMSDDEALHDLCKIFGVDYNSLPKDSDKNNIDKDVREEASLLESLDCFNIHDFKSMIIKGKKERKGVGYFNSLVMIMVNELKSNGQEC